MGTQTRKREQSEQSVVTQVRTTTSSTGATSTGSVLRPVPAPPHDKKTNPMLGLVFVAAALVLGFFAWKSDSDSRHARTEKVRDLNQIDALVNKHLIMTNQRLELQREKARLENDDEQVPEVGDSILPRWKPHETNGVDQSSDRNEANAARDLEKPDELNMTSPDTIIQSEIADSQTRRAYEKKYKEEYARRFIENARAGGYEIELDENFIVTRVRKIDDGANQPHLFRGASPGQ